MVYPMMKKSMNNEKGLSLYEIASAYQNLNSIMESGSHTELTEYLDGIQAQLEDKVSNVIKYGRGLELTASAIDTEIDRLTALKRVYESRSESLKEYIKYSMLKHDITKVDTDIAKISFRKSVTTEIDDVEKLPKEFVIIKTSLQPDKKAIKEALESGKVVPGAHVESHNNLVIK